MTPIAVIYTPFADKFSVPRQPGLAPAIKSRIQLTGDYHHAESIRGIEQHSHLWLLFEFNQNPRSEWKERVRPPRLGGNDSVGVFATRSPFRPNGLGLSVVKLEQVLQSADGHVELLVSGADLVTATPIVDIKPYIPYVDSVTDAYSELAAQPPIPLTVSFSPQAKQQLTVQQQQIPELADAIRQVLSQDPRPAYHKKKQTQRRYVSRLYHLELHWQVNGQQLMVEEITPVAA